MTCLEQVQRSLRWKSDHDMWFAEKIVFIQNGKEFSKPEPKLEDYLTDKRPTYPEFPEWCQEVANAVGPSLAFVNGNVRLSMSNDMERLYKKYVTKEQQ